MYEYYSKEDKICTSFDLSTKHFQDQRAEMDEWFWNTPIQSICTYDHKGYFYSLTELIEFKMLFGGVGPIDAEKIRPPIGHAREEE